MDRNIIYVPDFVINAGGLINVYLDYLKEYSKERSYSMADKIYDNCRNIVDKAENEKISPQEAAISLAEKRISEVGKVKLSF